LEEIEEEVYLDDIETLDFEEIDRKVATEAMELNILQKFTKSYPCSQCSFAVG
jgi:hypothetical protein